MMTVAQLLDGHVTLEVESVDRLYLNGYIPILQTGPQVVRFLEGQRQAKCASPALLEAMGRDFDRRLGKFAAENGLVKRPFEKDEDKDKIAAAIRRSFARPEGVYLIGVAQEKCSAFKGHRQRSDSGWVNFEYSRQSVRVNQIYFYLVDDEFGPAFIKVGTYAPYPVRVCLNGHEWLKRQLTKAGIGFEALDNGILSCEDAPRLAELAASLGPAQILKFFHNWLARLPLPLSSADRKAGYDWRLSIWQMEVSLTQVFRRPLHGRQFFDEVIRGNLDIGRPERVQLLFDRRITKATPGRFLTRVVHSGVHPRLHLLFKSCDIKQYFKLCRALRTETTINNPRDFGLGKDLSNFSALRGLAAAANRRLIDSERVSEACTLDGDTVATITHPTVTEDGQRAPALHFADPRTTALMAALFITAHLPTGFSNRTLRRLVADFLGPGVKYGSHQMTYDLRRLRLKNLIGRSPGKNAYQLTPLGLRTAAFWSKLHFRLFRVADPCLAPAGGVPRRLCATLSQLDQAIDALVTEARIEPDAAVA